jgi:hypothetical protein
MSWEQELAALDAFYPGSSQKIERPTAPVRRRPSTPEPKSVDTSDWDARPRSVERNGRYYEVFAVGHLAKALNRSPVTIRLWEDKGVVPLPDRSASDHPQMRHRIYSRPQIEGMRKIAEEEGILYPRLGPPLSTTHFKDRVRQLFRDLSDKPLHGALEMDSPKQARQLR